MSQNNFPFGKKPKDAGFWLPSHNTKSRRWSVAYIAGLSILCGQHTMIFFGLDNLQIGVVKITGCGPSASIGTKGMTRGSGSRGTIRRPQIERIIETAEDAVNYTDYFGDIKNVSDAKSGLSLLHMLNNNPIYIESETPFSFRDIEMAWGSISGFGIDVYIAGAQVYIIDMSPDVIAGDTMYIRDRQVYNLDDGSIGAGLGVLQGKWSVERSYDLWAETSARAVAGLGFKALPAETPDVQPNSTIPNNIHPFLRELPIQGYPIPEHLLKKFFP